MKKVLTKISLLLFFLIILSNNISNGSSSITFFYLDSIIIDNNDIEIVSDEISIDTNTSKIKNNLKIKNTSSNDMDLNLAIPLENEELGQSIRDLEIMLNGVKVDYVKGNDGKYLVKSKISANSGKEINIEYYTENDLQNAKIIKCNFDNLKGKKVGKLKVDVIIDSKNVPLVEKIYPGHFTFENNTISVEYYNYEVNTITKDVIVRKETFNNLLYGREVNLTNEEKNLVQKWYDEGNVNVNINDFYQDYYNQYASVSPSSNEKCDDDCENESQTYRQMNFAVNNILEYSYIKNGKIIPNSYEMSEPLLYGMYKVKSDESSMYERDLEGRIICIDYVETEDDKELYVSKVTEIDYSNDAEPGIYSKYTKERERTILKIKGASTAYAGKRGAKIITIGEGLDGESLNATDQEKVSYINQINADMYIRIEIYDGTLKYKIDDYGSKNRIGQGMVGYYDDNNLELAKKFTLGKWDDLKTEQIYKNGYGSQFKLFYQNYEEYSKNYYNDYFNDCLVKLNNEEISNKCEIPTVVQFVGNRVEEDGKYVIKYFQRYGFYDGSDRGLISVNQALQTEQAKEMLSSNKQKNKKIKIDAEAQISNFRTTDDETNIQKQIQDEIEELRRQEELKKQQEEDAIKAKEMEEKNRENTKNILILSGFGVGIIACIVAIVFIQKKKKAKNNKGK